MRSTPVLRRSFSLVVLVALVPSVAIPAAAESAGDVSLRFSTSAAADAVQPGCTTFDRNDNPCHQIAAMMNGLDSPKVDVLVLVPASPTAERDARIMRQSVEMWADGIDALAAEMGLQWLADGVEFHIFSETPSFLAPGEAEFTTYPIVDPEIVVIATNPVGGIGIGIDPLPFIGQIFGEGVGEGPCHGVKNPFDMALWEALPGFDSHHGGRGGTYVEDCGGAGGNICFSVNGAVDPATSVIDIFQLYDLVSHETGHCLTLGHVGDGAEGSWSSVPTNDIMAYHSDPPGLSKCVSTLDVEALAVAMSRFLDVNLDGQVTIEDHVYANDHEGDESDTRPFQVQHPDNHWYASSSREAVDCPQPDMGPVPLAEVVNFTPQAPARPFLAIAAKQGLSQQDVPLASFTLRGSSSGIGGADRVVLSALRAPNGLANGTAPENFTALTLGVANTTVQVLADGSWTGTIDLSAVAPDPNGTWVVVSATWLDAANQVVDSDRVMVRADPAFTQAAASDAPGPAPLLLAVALMGLALWRRRA